MRTRFVLLFAFLLAAVSVSASTLNSYNVAFDMRGAFTVIDISYDFSSLSTPLLQVYLPSDAVNISVAANQRQMNASINRSDESSLVRVNLTGGISRVAIRFVSSQYTSSNTTFSAFVRAPYFSKLLTVNLTLPEQSILRTGLGSEQVGSPSLVPQPDKVDFPSGRLRFSWERTDAAEGTELGILAQYYLPQVPEITSRPAQQEYPSSMLVFVPVLSILTTLAMIGLLAFLVARKLSALPGDAEEMLMDDEAQVVRVLKSKGGACEQGTLCIVTGFSKAKLSELLSELEMRRVIYKKKRGNKNIIILRDSVQRFLSSVKIQE